MMLKCLILPREVDPNCPMFLNSSSSLNKIWCYLFSWPHPQVWGVKEQPISQGQFSQPMCGYISSTIYKIKEWNRKKNWGCACVWDRKWAMENLALLHPPMIRKVSSLLTLSYIIMSNLSCWVLEGAIPKNPTSLSSASTKKMESIPGIMPSSSPTIYERKEEDIVSDNCVINVNIEKILWRTHPSKCSLCHIKLGVCLLEKF